MKHVFTWLVLWLVWPGVTDLRARADNPVRGLDVYWADVEGGAATLIVTPSGQSVLIDTGMPGGRDSGRIFAMARKAGLTRIDFLVITHFHIDHFGGAAELAARIPIGVVYDNGIPDRDPDGNPDSSVFLKNIAPYRECKVRARRLIQPGMVIPLRRGGGGLPVVLRCLGAKQRFIAAPAGAAPNPLCAEAQAHETDTSDNANSIVLLLEFGPFRFFDGGDLTWNTERALVCPVNLVGRVDVYQVDHHGLDLSNNPVLVRSLAPTVSVMSNGTSKGCGANTFATLKQLPSLEAMYQIHGNLRADRENNAPAEYIANLEKNCRANSIKLSVAPDGRTFTMSIPATGHQRLFQTKSRS